jgi:hypothetical protein
MPDRVRTASGATLNKSPDRFGQIAWQTGDRESGLVSNSVGDRAAAETNANLSTCF